MSEGIATILEARELAETLLDGFLEEVAQIDDRLILGVAANDLPEAARRLRDDERLSCRYLSFVGGVDQVDYMEAIYLLRSMEHPFLVQIGVKLDRKNPVVPTVTHIWTGANWHERETFDLFGIRFERHPDLRRLLNREDMDVFPLRKDARPHRPLRPEWRWDQEPPLRLPGEPPRRKRS